MNLDKVRSVILAAGKGTRMKSDLPKVLHQVAGVPMILHALEAARIATDTRPVLVVGYGAEQVRAVVGEAAEYVSQSQQLGTGHAVQQAEKLLEGASELVLVTSADMPLLTIGTLDRLIHTQLTNPGPMTMLTVIADDPRGFGRVVRSESGNVQAIVEEPDATPEILAIRELNAGAYCFRGHWLWENLKRIPISSKGEYYLTDTVGIAVADGLEVRAISVENPMEAIGVNTLEHLLEADEIMRERTGGHKMAKEAQ